MKSVNEMTTRELKTFAEDNNIDITGLSKKADILNQIEQNKNEECANMEENTIVNEETIVNTGVEGTEGEAGTEVEVVPVDEAKVVYQLEDGSECSRSAYIRQEFHKDRSRQDIAKELGLKYYIVYSATANMYNVAHPENGGAGAAGKGSVLVPKVNSELKFVDAEGNTTKTVDVEGVPTEVELEEADAVTIPRADLMRELAQAGFDRAKIKDYFQVPYATVYAATKEIFDKGDGEKRGSKTVIHPDTQVEVKRADYIRELYKDGDGLDRREIAVALTKMTGELVDYATVWAATKPKKATEEVVEVVETPVDATEVETETETV